MAFVKLREVHAVARTGDPWQGPNGWAFGLADLYARTVPQEWVPQLDALESWEAGAYDVTREAAERVTDDLNETTPWEQ